MAPPRRSARDPYTYVHAGTVLVGDLVVEGRLRVDGTVRGSVRVSELLEVAPGGLIEGGSVHADEVRVAGTVRGDLHVGGRAELWSGGLVVGDIHAGSLDIEEGARFRGRSVMPGEEQDRDDVASGDPAPRALRPRDAGGGLPRTVGSAGPGAEPPKGSRVGGGDVAG